MTPPNPWSALPAVAPFVLPSDAPAVEAFNQRAAAPLRVETSLLPEPFVGRVEAPVILLTLNPGVSAGDFALHEDPAFQERVLGCHRQEKSPYPNYYLDPEVSGPGAAWVRRIARPLLNEFGDEVVANALTLVEFFPYHSERFAHGKLTVPSQRYTFALVRAAIERGAAIFITRGRELWYAAVPGLRDYRRSFLTRSVQNVVISPRNCPDGYAAVAASIRDAIGPTPER